MSKHVMDENVHKCRAIEEKLLQNREALAAIQNAHLEEVKYLQSQVAEANRMKLELETQSRRNEEELKVTISRLMEEKCNVERNLKKLKEN